jgi:hypothetical protein
MTESGIAPNDPCPPSDCPQPGDAADRDWHMVSRWVDDARKELLAVCPKPQETEAPAVADVGHPYQCSSMARASVSKTEDQGSIPCSGAILYTINSNRSRYQIIADYAAAHDLTATQVDELVKQLPDYGVRSMLHGSLAVLRPRSATVISMARARAERRR